jgi:hypothetical protein
MWQSFTRLSRKGKRKPSTPIHESLQRATAVKVMDYRCEKAHVLSLAERQEAIGV